MRMHMYILLVCKDKNILILDNNYNKESHLLRTWPETFPQNFSLYVPDRSL